MDTPGAVTSGLNCDPPCPGPAEENVAIRSKKAVSVVIVASIVAMVGSTATEAASAFPASLVIMTAGMVAPGLPPITIG